ncbi:MAG: ExbD/TolR family protein, partial [Gemmatimonadota bacterium]
MRTSHRARSSGSGGDLQVAPLIDIIFLLLTYFLFTISLSTIEGLLPSELALGSDVHESKRQPEQEDRQLVIRVIQTGQDAQYFLDDVPVGDFEVVSEQLAGTPPDTLVVIDAGANVAYEHVIRLYNLCLRRSIQRVVFPMSSAL